LHNVLKILYTINLYICYIDYFKCITPEFAIAFDADMNEQMNELINKLMDE